MAEGARLESVCTVYRTAGSNPALSVSFLKHFDKIGLFFVIIGNSQAIIIYGGRGREQRCSKVLYPVLFIFVIMNLILC